MEKITLGLACLFALIAIFVILLNYLLLYIDNRNKRLGVQHHVSMIFAIPQIFLCLSWFCVGDSKIIYMQLWILIIIGLIDPCVWVYSKKFALSWLRK